MKTCFLIGHRDTPFIIREKLEKAIAAAITEYGVTEFVVGQYGAFDKMAAVCLAEAKKAHPELRLLLLLPYHPAERAVVLPAGFDGSIYPPQEWRRYRAGWPLCGPTSIWQSTATC